MAGRAPHFEYASDEEPTENTYVSSAASAHEWTTSDDESDALSVPPTVPMVAPTIAPTDSTTRMIGSTFMETRHMATGPSREQTMRRTARISVRTLPTGPLAPRDKAPMVGSTELSPRVPRLAHLEWMTPTLERWRILEGIPSTFETGESSRSPAPIITTGEPVELTLPTLVAVIRTLFRISRGRDNLISELQSDVSRLDGDMIDMYERYNFLMGNMVAAREIAESARARVRVLEGRTRAAGLVIGACVLMAVLKAAVGLFLPYFY